ncbi:hypothetical protein EYF80_025425 [Liparis tanakae]|uniref:Uncharacterized protein n=1 Tax=Liparis tanakae TaxID=230148 RepID=A0A4Z2HHK9_9TELE|nr:hypothetical protein EYF80_025425 [Liparis tanakae]
MGTYRNATPGKKGPTGQQDAVKSPTPALTSTPLGASRVRVRVGDSSLRMLKVATAASGNLGEKGAWLRAVALSTETLPHQHK